MKVMAFDIIKCKSISKGLEVGILDQAPFLPPMKSEHTQGCKGKPVLQGLPSNQGNQIVDEPQIRGLTESSAPPSDKQKNCECPIC